MFAVVTASLGTGCGGSDSAIAPPPEEEPEGPPDRTAVSIELLTDSVRPMGMLGVTFRARARGRNAAGEIIPSKEETWSTDTPDILEVTPEGDVRSVSEGEGRVMARLDGAEGVIRVPVREVARLEWQGRIGGQGIPSPSVGQDGTVYASGVGASARFWAFEPGGAVKWSLGTPALFSTPAIGENGMLYVGVTADGSNEPGVYALRPDGQTVWRRPTVGQAGPPSLGPDGKLYTMVLDTGRVNLTALAAAEGGGLWEYGVDVMGLGRPMAPALAPGGHTVYFRTRDGHLHAVSEDGEPRWSLRLGGGGEMNAAPAVGPDGTIYLGSRSAKTLFAVSPDGVVVWSLDLGASVANSAALGVDGTIYQAAGPVLYAISSGGEVLWNWTLDGVRLISTDSPAVGGDGTIYIGLRDRLYAIGPDGTAKWDLDAENVFFSTPVIGLDGMIYATSMDSVLYAIRELDGGNGGFDASPWPVWRGNRQNTGRVGP